MFDFLKTDNYKKKEAREAETKGENFHKSGKYEEAVKEFDMAIRLRSGDLYDLYHSHYRRGLSYAELGKKAKNKGDKKAELEFYGLAIKDLDEALCLHVEFYTKNCDKKNKEIELKNKKTEFKLFNFKSFEINEGGEMDREHFYDPNVDTETAPYYFNLGIVKHALGLQDEALKDLDQAIQRHNSSNSNFYYPEEYASHFNARGIIKEKLNRFEEAFEDYKKATELAPKGYTGVYFVNCGLIKAKLKEHEWAIEYYEKAIQICRPQKASYFYYRAVSYNALEEYDKAILDLKEALKLSPNYSLAEKLLNTCQNKIKKPILQTPIFQPQIHQPQVIQNNYNPPIQILNPLQIQQIKYNDIKFEKKIGEGGFGIVWQAKWQYNPVAVKLLKVTQLNINQIEEFQKEINFLAKLKHPNIVQFYGACTQEKYAIVMEFCDKGSLFNVLHIQKENLSWPICNKIAFDCSKGLTYLHDQKVIHRDIKSPNILITNDYTAKFTDFGVSKTKEHTISMTQSQIGTLCWMAPELFNMMINYTEQSDTYALGIVLWEISAKKSPYQAAQGNPQRVIGFKLQDQHDPIPENTPIKLANLIQWCRKMRPQERPTAKQATEELKSLVLN